MDDIEALFTDLLGEMDDLSQSLAADKQGENAAPQEKTFSIGFTNLNESLNELEDRDLDALVADLRSGVPPQESSPHEGISTLIDDQTSTLAMSREFMPADTCLRPTTQSLRQEEPRSKADKIRLALEKLKEAKVRKLIIKVMMSDNSSRTLMVDERQTVGEVLDMLFEKTHCDRGINWSLCETNPELQTERSFEDHENLVERLSAWTRHSENKIHFVLRPQKYVMFTEPQLFYMWKKSKANLCSINNQAKELLIKENFGGSTQIVPDLEGMLYLKEDGKKVWKPRYFVLRASGIYYVPKGKTKSSSDLACFVRFDKVNIYTTSDYKQKYRAPTNFCFILKHPHIQMESPYIKFLCCEEEHTLLLWVISIRIAKYGTILYENYQAAVKKATNLQSFPSPPYKDRYNGHSSLENPHPASSHVEDYPDEPPPDFIPLPPPNNL